MICKKKQEPWKGRETKRAHTHVCIQIEHGVSNEGSSRSWMGLCVRLVFLEGR